MSRSTEGRGQVEGKPSRGRSVEEGESGKERKVDGVGWCGSNGEVVARGRRS